MFLLSPPVVRDTEVFTRMPDALRRTGVRSDWADANRGGAPTDSFLEGPVFDAHGNLYVTDIPFGRIFRITAQGDQGAPDTHAIAQHLARNGAGSNAHRGLPRAGTPAAAIIANAVFQFIGNIGMARAKAILDFPVILAALVGVFNHQRNGCTGGLAFKHAG